MLALRRWYAAVPGVLLKWGRAWVSGSLALSLGLERLSDGPFMRPTHNVFIGLHSMSCVITEGATNRTLKKSANERASGYIHLRRRPDIARSRMCAGNIQWRLHHSWTITVLMQAFLRTAFILGGRSEGWVAHRPLQSAARCN